MIEQELQEELGILVKACQQCGAELVQRHIGTLRAHLVCVSTMVRKLDRLEAAAVEASKSAEKAKPSNPRVSEFADGSVFIHDSASADEIAAKLGLDEPDQNTMENGFAPGFQDTRDEAERSEQETLWAAKAKPNSYIGAS